MYPLDAGSTSPPVEAIKNICDMANYSFLKRTKSPSLISCTNYTFNPISFILILSSPSLPPQPLLQKRIYSR